MSADRSSILVLNVGSSTLKFGLFAAGGADGCIAHGTLEYYSGNDHESALSQLLDELERKSLLGDVSAIGHRLVHGGERFRDAVVIDASVRQHLRGLIPLAPDHLPTELRAIDMVSTRLPDLIQIACFDTAFHKDLPRHARLFGIPRKLADAGVVRYGFHGLSYEYIVTTLKETGQLPRRVIVAHLGNGASLAAILDGVSVDTSMGMTPTGGVVMSKRSGDVDPGAILFMMRNLGFSATDVEAAVDKQGGLLGISDRSSDMRALLSARKTDKNAEEAIDVFCHRVKQFMGAYAAILGGLDLIVFTGGIGEHSPEIRAQICAGLEFLGVEIDESRNQSSSETISTESGKVRVAVMRTDEEAMIARHVRRVLNGVNRG